MPSNSEDGQMSAFERKRLENIAANRAILTDISYASKKLIPDKISTPKSTQSSKKSRGRTEVIRREPLRATRMSSRLAGIDADNDASKRALSSELEKEATHARSKKQRLSQDLQLGDVIVEGRKWGGGVDGLSAITRGAAPGVRTFTAADVKETTDDELRDLRLRMNSLKLYEHWYPNDIKITPQRVYALGFHPMEDKPIVFAGDKDGAMGVFDGSQTAPDIHDSETELVSDRPDPIISAFKIHARTITAFLFSPVNAKEVYTSSYDSTIRKLDLEKGVSVQVFAPSDNESEMPLSAMDAALTEPNLLYFSTLDGSLGRHDIRTPPQGAEIWRLSDHKIGGFSLHPLQPHLIATASLDRTLKIWDIRKIEGDDDLRHPALLGEHESRLSVSHAAWGAGGQIATSSYDDTIKIYDFSNAGAWIPGCEIGVEAMNPIATLAHNNQTGRWVTILKPQWQRRPRDGIQKFTIANMNRFVDVYAADGSQLAQLDGEGITAVPAVAQLHPTKDWVAGGNGSGKLCLWL